jgi:hypothetical protein
MVETPRSIRACTALSEPDHRRRFHRLGHTAAPLSEPHRAVDFAHLAFDDDPTLVGVWVRKRMLAERVAAWRAPGFAGGMGGLRWRDR